LFVYSKTNLIKMEDIKIIQDTITTNRSGYKVYQLGGPWRNVWIQDCASNCKLTYINFVANLIGLDNKKAFDEILAKCRLACSFNVNNDAAKDWILKNYEVYSCSPVPIGYGSVGTNTHNQWHIVLKNPTCKTSYARPTLYKKNEIGNFKENLITLLKKNRRKLDIVDKIMSLL